VTRLTPYAVEMFRRDVRLVDLTSGKAWDFADVVGVFTKDDSTMFVIFRDHHREDVPVSWRNVRVDTYSH
jgi:hypothetical protein